LRTGGFHESFINPPDHETSFAQGMSNDELLVWLEGDTMLKRLPSVEEAGDLAAFPASDKAQSLTATAVNITRGSVSD
jgi:hypothetical protein